jgi:hypothetical protein
VFKAIVFALRRAIFASAALIVHIAARQSAPVEQSMETITELGMLANSLTHASVTADLGNPLHCEATGNK